MNNKKSQAALEFLTTYAWAFLVILLMIGALAYFGILKPTKILPDRCNFGTEVGCVDYKISATDNTFDIRLKNNAGEPIIVTAINLSSEAATSYLCNLISHNLTYTWRTGAVTDFRFSGCNNAAAGMIEGEKGKVLLALTYYASKSGSTYTHTVSGEVFATIV